MGTSRRPCRDFGGPSVPFAYPRHTHTLPSPPRSGRDKHECISLRKSQFGLSGQRKYPVDTRRRAANAKARAKQQLKRGRLSRSAYNRMVAKANRRLRRKG